MNNKEFIEEYGNSLLKWSVKFVYDRPSDMIIKFEPVTVNEPNPHIVPQCNCDMIVNGYSITSKYIYELSNELNLFDWLNQCSGHGYCLPSNQSKVEALILAKFKNLATERISKLEVVLSNLHKWVDNYQPK